MRHPFWSKHILIMLVGLILIATRSHAATGKSREEIIIHYGLNDSHSRSWAQADGAGRVGVTYFEHDEGSHTTGTLLYKTILSGGTATIDSIASGRHLEKSVLLFDAEDHPHIFVAVSNDIDQEIIHHYRNGDNTWQSETITNFHNEGGKFIYELSAAKGPDHSLHLLILKTRSDIDSSDFMDAWQDANLYHLANDTGSWRRELIRHYDMAYTYDMYIKTSSRQDIAIDEDGFAHVVFSEQLSGNYDPSRLHYATNRTGTWVSEIALSNEHGLKDDAGWFPSLALDNNGVPHIACMYINRVMTYSATYCHLYLLNRTAGTWRYEIVANLDDGYHGGDGRDYTGGLTHLIFDSDNTPHLLFTDIASTHWPVLNQCLNVGNIRYAVRRDDAWEMKTIHRQPLPTGFFDAVEMYGLCLIPREATGTIRVIGQEMVITGENRYDCRLLEFGWSTDIYAPGSQPTGYRLLPGYPNPFNPATTIEYSLSRSEHVEIDVLTPDGRRVQRLVDGIRGAGPHSVSWDGRNSGGHLLPSGVYLCSLRTDSYTEARKLTLIR
ncbi:MAG: hypothetical protein GY835_25295 [bacterium]|nr:hypothetical protein [bacterium]